jgi:hypothetical protein
VCGNSPPAITFCPELKFGFFGIIGPFEGGSILIDPRIDDVQEKELERK